MRPDWDHYGMSLAHTAALRSEDPHYKVGASALRKDHSLLATGYNGAPPGVNIDWSNRDTRRPFVCHAEVNCLKYARPGEVSHLYVSLSPCMACMAHIAAYGIKRVVYSARYTRETEAFQLAKKFGIDLIYLEFDLQTYVAQYSGDLTV
jgi:dCMP deaminase